MAVYIDDRVAWGLSVAVMLSHTRTHGTTHHTGQRIKQKINYRQHNHIKEDFFKWRARGGLLL